METTTSTDQETPTVDLTATDYPMLSALARGLVFGSIEDWPLLKAEAQHALAVLEPGSIGPVPVVNAPARVVFIR